jgi:hypothetical protein
MPMSYTTSWDLTPCRRYVAADVAASACLLRAERHQAAAGLCGLRVQAQLPLATQEREATPLRCVLFVVL